jgi:hypothetical protein
MRGRTVAPSKLLQVYVDDFCYAATQSKDGEHIPIIRWAAIHGIEAVSPLQLSQSIRMARNQSQQAS